MQSFALPSRFKVPDLLCRSELASRKEEPAFVERLFRLGLEVVKFTGDEVSRAVLLGCEYRSLPLRDRANVKRCGN